MIQVKKQKVTLTQLQRYLPFPSPSGQFTLPYHIQRFLASPSFNNYSYKQQNSIKCKLNISYRNYFPIQMIVDHLDQLTKGKYYQHSIQMAVKNAAQKYQLIDWYKFYQAVRRSKLIAKKIKIPQEQQFDEDKSKSKVLQQKEKASRLIQKYFKQYLYIKKVKKGRQQVQQIKKTLELKLIVQFSKQVQNEIKQLYQKNNRRFAQPLRKFQSSLQDNKINFILLEMLLNQILQMYVERKKIIYLYLHFDPENIGYFSFLNFKQLIFDIKKQSSFVAEKQYLSTIDKVLESIRKDMKFLFTSAYDMITQFNQKYLFSDTHNKNDQILFSPFYKFINDKGSGKYSKYQIHKILERVKYYDNFHFLYNSPKFDELLKAVLKITQKKQRKKMLHSENQVFYSYKKILLYIVSRCKSIKLNKQGFVQFIVSQDPALKYNSFFCVFRVFGNIINIKRIIAQSKMNPLACYLKTTKTQDQYEKLYDQILQTYPQTFQLSYSSLIDKLNLRLQFLLQNHAIKPLPNLSQHQIVNYRKTIKQIFQPDFDVVARSFIHKKVASKFVALYRRIRHNKAKAKQNAMSLISKAFGQETKKFVKKAIDLNDSRSRISSNKKLTTQKSISSCKTKKIESQKKYDPEDIERMKDILFDLIDQMNSQKDKQARIAKKLSKQNDHQGFSVKNKIVPIKKQKISFRSSISNSFAYHQLIGLLLYGNNNELMCYRNQKLQKLDIKLLYRPNIQILAYEIFQTSIVLLTSYFTLEFYKFHQSTKYPYKTIKIGEGKTDKISHNEIEQYMKSNQYGSYPKLIKRLTADSIGVNLTFAEESIWILRKNQEGNQKQQTIFKINITKRQHHYNSSLQKLIQLLKFNTQKKTIDQKNRLITEIIDFFNKIKEEFFNEEKRAFFQLSQPQTQTPNITTNLDPSLTSNSASNIFSGILQGVNISVTSPKLQAKEETKQKMQKNTEEVVNNPFKDQQMKNDSENIVKPLNLAQILKKQAIKFTQKNDLTKILQHNFKRFISIIHSSKVGVQQKDNKQEQISEYEFLQILKYFLNQNDIEFFRSELKQQLKATFKEIIKIKVPEQIKQVTNTIQQHLFSINYSLKDLIQKLDDLREGHVKIKKIKDYFLKITQEMYLIHEKKIDSYLRNLAIAKHISYESFVAIFTEWNLKVWEKPRFFVRDYILVEKQNILIYTIDEDKRIFVKNLKNDTIIAILQGHFAIPTISLIQNQLILISADSTRTPNKTLDIYVWMLNDILLKICSLKPLKVKPFFIKKNVHQQGISSICYLPKSNCLVTGSLDSTMKFHLIQENPFDIQQVQRLYYHDYYYLTVFAKSIQIQSDVEIQSLVTVRIKKHINQKNMNKYQITGQIYDVQKISIKSSKSNKFLAIPMKLSNLMELHGEKLVKRKQKLVIKKNQIEMEALMSSEFLQKSLQFNVFSAIKSYFIFNDLSRLKILLKFVQKQQNSSMILQNILLKYGLKIIDRNNFYVDKSERSLMDQPLQKKLDFSLLNLSKVEKEIQKGDLKIKIFQQSYQNLIQTLLKFSLKQSGLISIHNLRQIGQMIIYGKQLQKFNCILDYEQKKARHIHQTNKMQRSKLNFTISVMKNQDDHNSNNDSQFFSETLLVDSKQILKYFKVEKTKNNIQKFYQCLRELFYLLKKRKLPVWKLFSTFQQNISKQRKISSNNFKQQLLKLGFPSDKIQLILFYLAENQRISIFQTLNYLQIAIKESNEHQQLNITSNLSFALKDSVILDQEKILQNFQQRKNSAIKQVSSKKHSIRQNSLLNRINMIEVQSSNKDTKQKKSQDVSGISSKKQSRKNSVRNKKSQQRSQSKSKKLTPSNSLGNLTRQISYSNTKDSKKKQVYQIRHKLHNLLANQRKTLWQLVSSAVPQFLQESVITQNQYFDIFKLLKSTLKLSEKLNLLSYLKQLNPQRVIDLNDLFQLLEDSNSPYVQGQKYIIPYFANKIVSGQQYLTIQQGLQIYFFPQNQQEITHQQFIQRCLEHPFKFTHFALKEFEELLIRQSKSGFIKQDIIDLIDKVCQKYEIKIENKNLTILQQILFKMDKRKILFQQIFNKVQMVNESYFIGSIQKLNQKYEKKHIIKDFQSIKLKYKKSLRKNLDGMPSSTSRKTSKSTTSRITQIPYSKFKMQILALLDQTRKSSDKQRHSAIKLTRYLEGKRISVFNFFISLDLQKKFYLNEVQFETGLTQIDIEHSFWGAIQKKFQNRLYYHEFVKYLVDNNILDIKCIDSQIQVAMQKLIKKVIKNNDIEAFYQKLISIDEKKDFKVVTFNSFSKFFSSNYSIFSKKQVFYLFSTFCNSQQIKNSKFSNDQVIKNQQNIQKEFNFKMFLDVIGIYKTQTITKTALFKFIDFLKKRNISLIHQFYKFMEKNKKNKQVAQALKKKQTTLPKDLIFIFMNEIKTGLNQKEIKEILHPYSQNKMDFSLLNQKLEQIYRKASSYIQKQEAEIYLGEIYKKSKSQNVSMQRLFVDFCQESNNKLTLKDLISLATFLSTGLNKIQLKKVFTILLDQQNKGYCFLSQMMQAIQNIEQKIDKDQQDYQFEYIIEKIQNNIHLVNLKQSQINFPLSKCIIIFQKFLTHTQISQFYNKVIEQQKKMKQLTQKDIFMFINKKLTERKIKNDKKYKELVLSLLNTIKKSNIEIFQVFKYFTAGSRNNQSLAKDRFLLLYQSVILKSNFTDVSNLYMYLDDNKNGNISLQKWEQKLAIVDLQNQNLHGSIDQLKVFYKVKLFLSELYLTFVQKQYKIAQIFNYFDKNSNGHLKYHQFWTMIYELGYQPSQDLEKKVVNYLDRTKSKTIDIKILMKELQNCLGKKQKVVLQTKTSFIFKRNEDILKSKYSYFINQIIKQEQLVEIELNDNEIFQESCITQINFLSILRRFGIYLTDEQLKDLNRNFQARKDYLLLYPIYFMLRNIFQQHSSFQEKGQSQKALFKNLLNQMIRSKITLRQIQKIKSHDQMKSLLKELKIFTPIQTDIIIQSISYEETSVIDPEKLKIKIRDSYITSQFVDFHSLTITHNISDNQALQQSLNPIIQDEYLNEVLRDQLRGLLKFESNIQLLQKYPKHLYQQHFKQILVKLGCKITIKDMKKYFKAFSQNKKFIKAQNLIFQTNYKAVLVQQNENQKGSLQDINLLIQHISKSLKYTNKSFIKGVQKYFTQNYGFIQKKKWIRFLRQIGYQEGKSEDATIQRFTEYYQNHYQQLQSNKKCQQFQTAKLQDILSTQEDQQPNQTQINQNKAQLSSNRIQENKQIIKPVNQELKKIVFDLKSHRLNFIDFLKKNQCLEFFSVNDLYRYIIEQLCPKHFNQKQKLYYSQSAKNLCYQFRRREITLDILQSKLNHLIKYQFILGENKNQLQNLKTQPQSLFRKIYRSNLIQIFGQQVQKFIANVSKILISPENLGKLALSMLFEKIQATKHLLFIESLMDKRYQRNRNQVIQINSKFDDIVVNIISGASLIIQTQNELEDKALVLINQKFEAMSIHRKQQFDTFAKLSTHLNPSSYFIRAKGFYLWQPNKAMLPKCSIAYRWKFIKPFAKNLLSQISKINQLGYCCPHLRFYQLNQDMNAIIDKVLYPCKIDLHGKIVQIKHQELFDLYQPYCAPQILKEEKDKISWKCDSWIFGCLLYEFIWGHQPKSYFEELVSFLKIRNGQYQIEEAIFMKEPPCQFKYNFFNSKQILNVFEREFFFQKFDSHNNLELNIKKWQSLKGLTYPLEIIFGKQYVYYQQEFNILTQIHQIISQSLDPDPLARPSIQQLQKRQIFSNKQNFNLKSYIETLDRHLNFEEFEIQFIDKIQLLEKQDQEDLLQITEINRLITNLLGFLNKTLGFQSKLQKVDNIFTIPKSYPWPENIIQQRQKHQYPYSYNLQKNKQVIRQNPIFNIITKIFKSNLIFKIIKVYVSVSQKTRSYFADQISQDQLKQSQSLIQILLFMLIQMTKSYNSPAVGFVTQIIDYFLFYIYQNQNFNLKIDSKNQIYSTLGAQSRYQKIVQSGKKLDDYFKLPFFSPNKLQFIKKIQNIIYLNGQGNSQYLSIADYLAENQTSRAIVEVLYSAIDLMTLTSKCQLAINYFRDRLFLTVQMPQFMKILKIQLLVLRNLHEKSTKQICLSYFNQVLNDCSQVLPIFYTPIFYLSLDIFLRNPLENCKVKTVCLDVIKLLFQKQDQKIMEIMKSSCCNIFPFIVRLFIEPSQNLSIHEQYQILQNRLEQLLKIIENSVLLTQIFEQVPGGLYALKYFKGEQQYGSTFYFTN